MSVASTAAAVKLGIFALDQIVKWTQVAIEARKNPEMTVEEADALVAKEQRDAANVGSDWDEFRRG